jgi:LAO/AO transport system kinase
LASAASGAGLAELHQALARHRAWAEGSGALKGRRGAQEKAWVEESIRARFGSEGLAQANAIRHSAAGPFTRELEIARELTHRLKSL